MAPHASEGTPDLAPEKVLAPRKYEIVYFNVLYFVYWHLAGLYGLYLCFTDAKWQTLAFAGVVYVMADLGITAGAHRLWSHRAYKAKMPLQILLMVFNSMAFENTVIHWVRNHRAHHKRSDTDGDPHNAQRGFFFSHVGWLLVKKHPLALEQVRLLDMSDLLNNPVLCFQQKYGIPFIGALCFVIPTLVPVYSWGEGLSVAWHVNMLRYILNINCAFLVNSAAHIWGCKPYDKNIAAAQAPAISIATLGEGFHNYHHAFSWDYRAAELGNNWLNLTTLFIDFFALIGWAYDLKTVPDDVIKRRMARTGDGTDLWGWGDKDMKREDIEAAEIRCPGKESYE